MELMKGNYSLEEKGKLWEYANCPDIADAFFRAHDAEQEMTEMESRLEKTYEVRLEQSEFRAQALEAILKLCDECAPQRKGSALEELIAGIRIAVENHGVEL